MERRNSLQRGHGAKERSGDQVSSLLYYTRSQKVMIKYEHSDSILLGRERAVLILEEVVNTESSD